MKPKFSFNEIVKVTDSKYSNIYKEIGEIVGCGEDIYHNFGFLVQFDKELASDPLPRGKDVYYFVDEAALETTGQKGSKKSITEGSLQIQLKSGETSIILVKNLNDLDADKPYTYKYKDAFVLKFRENYDFVSVLSFIDEVEKKIDKIKEKKVIFDFSDWKYLGTLGMSVEALALAKKLKLNNKKVTFYGLNKSSQQMFSNWADSWFNGQTETEDCLIAPNFKTLDEALKQE